MFSLLGAPGLISGWGTKILQAVQYSQKTNKQNKEEEENTRDFSLPTHTQTKGHGKAQQEGSHLQPRREASTETASRAH